MGGENSDEGPCAEGKGRKAPGGGGACCDAKRMWMGDHAAGRMVSDVNGTRAMFGE